MKLFVLISLSIIISICAFAQNEAITEGAIAMWEGGDTDLYYYVEDFNDHDFGTLGTESNLYLKSGQLEVFVSPTGNIVDADMYYRIYKEGETPSDFINANLPWHSEWYDLESLYQLWWNDEPDDTDLNLLDGIEDGNYVIEVYLQAENGTSEFLYLNNDNLNYKAYFTYDTSTDIANETGSSIANLDLYPNPSSNSLSIKLNDNIDIKSISILNCESKIVYANNELRINTNTPIEIPIHNLNSGIYFIRIETSKGIELKRFIISK